MKNLFNLSSLSLDEINAILNRAQEFADGAVSDAGKGKVIGSLFFEPSTRTQNSYTMACYKLGANVITFNSEVSSMKKGETFYDTVKVFEEIGCSAVIIRDKQNEYCMVGYRVGNTLSESGSVARGVCETNEAGYLTGVVERTAIERIDGDIQFIDENGQKVVLEENVPVSMNMWGFTPDYFVHSEKYFVDFLKENIDKPKSEFFIPLVVNELITKGIATVKVLDTTAKWFGVTYAADRQGVVDKIQALVDAGEYPNKLF